MSLAILDFLNHIFLPEYCIICNKSGSYICSHCLKFRFKVNFRNICHVCGNNSFKKSIHKECEDSTNLDKLYFFCEYNLAAKKLIESIKYSGNYSLINKLALDMSSYLTFVFPDYANFVFTSVPSHKYKRNQRGFNQSELLAKEVTQNLNCKYMEFLTKTQNTKKQAGTSKNSRNINLRNTISALNQNVTQNVIIIDDVHTTGATLNECAGVLKKMGAKRVFGFTFAKSMNFSSIESREAEV